MLLWLPTVIVKIIIVFKRFIISNLFMRGSKIFWNTVHSNNQEETDKSQKQFWLHTFAP